MVVSNSSTKTQTRKKGKGARPKPLPQRTCIACRDKTAKRTLIRIVRTPSGQVEIDPTGRANGRGAYLCENLICWDRALRSSMLANALRTELDESSLERLREFAATINPVEIGEEAQSQGAK
jgi:uncharacterized protein